MTVSTRPTDAHTPHDSIRENFRPRIRQDVIIDRTRWNEIILLHPTEPRWAVTNQSGLDFLSHMDGARTVATIASDYAAKIANGTPSETISRDLLHFVDQLYHCDLLVNRPLFRKAPSARTPNPPSLTIYLTEQCNLRCRHCAIVEGRMPEDGLTSEDVQRIIDDHTSRFQNPAITFLGGEPMLRADCLDLLAYAAERTTQAKIGTNGLLIRGKEAQRLARIDAQVQVSLDGADPDVHDFIRGRGTYEKTWEAIRLLIRHGMAPRLIVAAVLTRAMLSQVQDMIALVDDIGPIRKLRFLNLNKLKAADTNWERISPDPEEMKRIFRWLLFELAGTDRTGKTPVQAGFPGYVPDLAPEHGAWCPLGQTLVVDSQGETYNCPTFNTGEYQLGQARDNGPAALLATERNAQLREKILERRYAIKECVDCSWRNFCQGGCAAYSSLRSGSHYVNDEFCEFRRDLYREHVHRSIRKS